jgi:hypothetical protein
MQLLCSDWRTTTLSVSLFSMQKQKTATSRKCIKHAPNAVILVILVVSGYIGTFLNNVYIVCGGGCLMLSWYNCRQKDECPHHDCYFLGMSFLYCTGTCYIFLGFHQKAATLLESAFKLLCDSGTEISSLDRMKMVQLYVNDCACSRVCALWEWRRFTD